MYKKETLYYIQLFRQGLNNDRKSLYEIQAQISDLEKAKEMILARMMLKVAQLDSLMNKDEILATNGF